ncbi:MAG: mandelate racemase/muconate lactonizing enzyme family protein [Rhodospirillales bacterium]
MKITRISVFQKTLPLKKPYALSGGRLIFKELDSTFVKIETDEGLTGWAEGCPWGHTYLPAHGPGLRAAIETMAPAVLGLDPRQAAKLNRAMDLALPGHLYAKAPLDIACLDIAGRAAGLPIADLLGGRYDGPAPVASSISTGTPDEMLALINEYRAAGYRVHSAKIGGDTTLDIERVRRLAADERPGEFIFFDVNRAWTVSEAVTVMNAVTDVAAVFEQPCETLEQCAHVARRTRHAISIDERLETPGDLHTIITGGIGEIVNIKINRVGGLTRARLLRDICLHHGIRMLVMETGGSALADTQCHHLAQSIPPEYLLGTWLCHEMLSVDPVPPRAGSRNINGCAAAPEAPGLGVAPDEPALGAPTAVYEYE